MRLRYITLMLAVWIGAAPCHPLSAQTVLWQELTTESIQVNTVNRSAVGALYITGNEPGGPTSFVIKRSTDDGVTWTTLPVGNTQGLSIYDVETLPDGDILAAGAGTLLHSTDGGGSWTRFNNPYQIGEIIPGANGTVIGLGAGIFRSGDKGHTWTRLRPTPTDSARSLASWLRTRDGVLYLGTLKNLYRSTDNGDSWDTAAGMQKMTISALAADSVGRVFAVSRDGLGFRSTDNGVHWITASGTLPAAYHNVAVDGKGELWAALVYASTPRGGTLYRSNNSGESWTDITGTLNKQGLLAIMTDPQDRVYIVDGRLRRSTTEAGFSEPGFPGPAAGGSPLHLEQNAPNPFDGRSVIGFRLDAPGHVTIDLLTVDGRAVATLLDERREAGIHRVQIDGSGLPPGVYLYRMRAGTVIATRAMVVAR